MGAWGPLFGGPVVWPGTLLLITLVAAPLIVKDHRNAFTTPAHGVIEVGHINFAPALQRTPAATEAMYLMMRQVFDVWGYRRYEWKCNDLNNRSKQAAHWLGFSFEGVFRQAAVIKGHNRDTAWFSMLDSEWPTIKTGFERWLDVANFDETGKQRQSLMQLRDPGAAG